MVWHNWSRLSASAPAHVLTPGTADEVSQAVNAARDHRRQVKMIGSGHSFTDISAPVGGASGVMLRPDSLTGITAVDRDAMTVTAGAGTRLADLNAALEAIGLSLHNMGDIAEQTLAGAISTGTHGTGGEVAGLAGQVAGLELVIGSGELVTVTDEDPELLDLCRVGLGALGIITAVTFRVEPAFGLQADERPMSWAEFLATFDELTAPESGRPSHLDAYWFPHTDTVSTKRNTRVDLAAIEPLSRLRGWFDDDFTQNTVFGALCAVTNRVPSLTPTVNKFAAKALAARSYSDLAHRVYVAPRRVRFREMEYAVQRDVALDLLTQVRKAVDASGLAISFPVEIRTAPAETAALSTAHGRDSVYLAFHVHGAVDHRSYFDLVEPILAAAGGRPHWGKLHSLDAADLMERYPQMGQFIALRDRLDPERTFANPYLDRVLGS